MRHKHAAPRHEHKETNRILGCVEQTVTSHERGVAHTALCIGVVRLVSTVMRLLGLREGL